MSTPPPEYYIGVAKTIESFAPFAAFIGGVLVLLSLRKYKIIAGIVPVIICPLAYIVGLWYLTSNGPYRDKLFDIVNYDSNSAAMRHHEFYFGAIWMLSFSVLVYLIFVLVLLSIERLLNRRTSILTSTIRID